MVDYEAPTGAEWVRTLVALLGYVLVVLAGAVVALPDFWYLWGLVAGAGLYLLVRWHSRRFGYRCPACSHEFEITSASDFLSPQGFGREGGWKRLTCPDCGTRGRTTVLARRMVDE